MAADSSPRRTAPQDDPAGRGGRLTLWCVAIVLLVLTVLGGRHPQEAASGTPPVTGPAVGTAPAGNVLPRSAPTRLTIPKISVDAPFTTLTLGSDGRLNPPPAADTNLVGWYDKGVAPGEKGTAIIAGHVDTKTSAAVFANLDDLVPGDRFSVHRADGRTATFVVDNAQKFEKDAFPSKLVYDDASRPEVRLITCAGDYDHSAKDYTENLVVFAHLL